MEQTVTMSNYFDSGYTFSDDGNQQQHYTPDPSAFWGQVQTQQPQPVEVVPNGQLYSTEPWPMETTLTRIPSNFMDYNIGIQQVHGILEEYLSGLRVFTWRQHRSFMIEDFAFEQELDQLIDRRNIALGKMMNYSKSEMNFQRQNGAGAFKFYCEIQQDIAKVYERDLVYVHQPPLYSGKDCTVRLSVVNLNRNGIFNRPPNRPDPSSHDSYYQFWRTIKDRKTANTVNYFSPAVFIFRIDCDKLASDFDSDGEIGVMLRRHMSCHFRYNFFSGTVDFGAHCKVCQLKYNNDSGEPATITLMGMSQQRQNPDWVGTPNKCNPIANFRPCKQEGNRWVPDYTNGKLNFGHIVHRKVNTTGDKAQGKWAPQCNVMRKYSVLAVSFVENTTPEIVWCLSRPIGIASYVTTQLPHIAPYIFWHLAFPPKELQHGYDDEALKRGSVFSEQLVPWKNFADVLSAYFNCLVLTNNNVHNNNSNETSGRCASVGSTTMRSSPQPCDASPRVLSDMDLECCHELVGRVDSVSIRYLWETPIKRLKDDGQEETEDTKHKLTFFDLLWNAGAQIRYCASTTTPTTAKTEGKQPTVQQIRQTLNYLWNKGAIRGFVSKKTAKEELLVAFKEENRKWSAINDDAISNSAVALMRFSVRSGELHVMFTKDGKFVRSTNPYASNNPNTNPILLIECLMKEKQVKWFIGQDGRRFDVTELTDTNGEGGGVYYERGVYQIRPTLQSSSSSKRKESPPSVSPNDSCVSSAERKESGGSLDLNSPAGVVPEMSNSVCAQVNRHQVAPNVDEQRISPTNAQPIAPLKPLCEPENLNGMFSNNLAFDGFEEDPNFFDVSFPSF